MKNNKPNFVLVHGAWHGGWIWKEVADLLLYQGYNVTCPTQTGLGERRHLLSSEITLDTSEMTIASNIPPILGRIFFPKELEGANIWEYELMVSIKVSL